MRDHPLHQDSAPPEAARSKLSRQTFLSLKWKALLLTSLVLIGISGVFSALSYFNQIKQFERQREVVQQRNREEVLVLLQESSRRLQQLGGMISSLTGMRDALRFGAAQEIQQAFEQHGPLLQIGMGIDSVYFYDNTNKLLVSWDIAGELGDGADAAPDWVRQSHVQESPVTYLDCRRDCVQYVATPILAEDRIVGVVALGVSLADVILAFNRISGADAGLIISGQDVMPTTDTPERELSPWGARVTALTGASSNLRLLQRVARDHPNLGTLGDGARLSFDNRDIGISLVTLPNVGSTGKGYLVVMEDITRAVARIESAIRQNLAVGALGLLLSVLLLLALLWNPMSRLHRTSITLPLLARSAFREAREAIRGGARRRWFGDEIDVLDSAAVELSYQLEQLNSELKERAQALAERVAELARERDFVTHLLNTAQVIIVTQNSRGDVLTLNAYGQRLSGYQEQDIQGKPFTLIGAPDDAAPSLRGKLTGLPNGGAQQWRHESVLIGKDGARRDIVWLHSALGGRQSGAPTLLSVGLDITERKQAESDLQHLYGSLEIRVAERTEQLSEANRQLLDEIGERKLAEEALARQAQDLLHSQHSLRSQTRILQSILDSMADGVIVADQDGGLILSNPAARAISGSDPVAIKLENWTDYFGFYLPDMVTPYPHLELPLMRAIRGEAIDGEEIFVYHPQRLKGAWLSANARPLQDRDGVARGGVVVLRDITERKQSEQRMVYLAQYDMLTGLPNRSLFRDRLNHALTRTARNEGQIALMFLDLDHFKHINDALGHAAGDLVLKGAAERLVLCLRDGDTVARLGGDEFTILLEEVSDTADIDGVARKILEAFAQPFFVEGRELFISTSIGVALCSDGRDDIDNLIKKADVAMYQAKYRGRNNYQLYNAAMYTPALERMSLTNRLRHAVARGEMAVQYQPQVELLTGRIVAVEALLTWNDSEQGLIPPTQFIALAEESGLIVALGEWVLQTACAQNKSWQDAGLPRMRVAVNISARQFHQPRLIDMIERVLHDTGLAPCYLDLEITEGLLMENIEESNQTLARLKEMDVYISIDDFGTGYSSLNYLKRFPVDVVKLDRSFVQNITTSPTDAAIARTVIGMAKTLKLKVVAEGVETAEQLSVLRAQHCDCIQGHYFSPPLSALALTELLREERKLA